MPTCATCGRETPAGFRFCANCGALLAVEPIRHVRKRVTVLFCDMAGSTARGEQTDPEALRRAMSRYFDEARAILERHGGTVEKFIGDAVMAVFGLPVAREDDALRAVRAAAELRDAQSALAVELRIGVNTGEVVAGEGETLATGDSVNVAARLEQTARPGEVLIGEETRRLVRDAAEVEAVEPLELKGKSAPVRAYRLLKVTTDVAGFARRLDSPLVGRTRELQRLRDDFGRAVSERTCQLFTLLGAAGVGKSRLVAEFFDELGDSARFVRGRCLHYGEGITYWPLVEVLKQLGAEPDDIIGSSPEETQLSFRRLLEREAASKPLVAVFDDLHWAEPVFLDLIEHIADLSRGASIFLLCVARPELLDGRPAWGGGKLNATAVLLEPLDESDISELIAHLVGDTKLEPAIRSRIVAAAQGNALFVEEMLAMAAEDGNGDVVVPPTIHALLQARLDRLGQDERTVVESGAVEGQVFHRGAVVELARGTNVDAQLPSLVRKELVRPDTSGVVGDDAYRFRHLLIRDAAYDSLPKETRAELHERFASWVDRNRDLVEQDEIVGYHLEQAARYRAQIGEPNAELSSRAFERLAAAGKGAGDRGDQPAANALLERATALLPVGDVRRLELLVPLVRLRASAGDFDAATRFLAELEQHGDERLRAHAAILAELRAGSFGTTTRERTRAVAAEAVKTFSRAGDERGVAEAWQLQHVVAWNQSLAERAAEALERALEHARRADASQLVTWLEMRLLATRFAGPTPLAEVTPAIEAFAAGLEGRVRVEMRFALNVLARIRAMEGRFEEARRLHRAGIEMARELGVHFTGWSQFTWFIERFAGDFAEAERALRDDVEGAGRLGERALRSTTALCHSDVLHELGRDAEAAAVCDLAEELSPPDDISNEVGIRAVRAKLLARRGAHDDARLLAEDAWRIAEQIDVFSQRTHVLEALADVSLRAGDRDAARVAAEQADAEWHAKGALVRPIPLQRLLAELEL